MTSEYSDLKKLFFDIQPFSQEKLDKWCQKYRILELTTPGFKHGIEPIYVELKDLNQLLIQLDSLFKANDRAKEANAGFSKDSDEQQIQAWIEKYEELFEQVVDANLDILENHTINSEEKIVLFTKEYGYHSKAAENFPPVSSDWGDWIITHKISFKSQLDPIKEAITFCDLFWNLSINDSSHY